MAEQDLTIHTNKYLALIESQKNLLLSTVSATGEPECSYAPYVRDKAGFFYIFVSELASHTHNMLHKGSASVMFIQPEQQSQNLFARERVIFNCKVSEVKKDNENYDEQLLHMATTFGETIALLRGLPDFHLLSLRPLKGRYIAGFGQAFNINVENGLLQHQIKK